MNAVIQRVSEANVKVDSEYIGRIGCGILVLLGVANGDNMADAEYLVDKIINLRIFEDDQKKLNLSILDVKGELLIVSQFTLQGDCRKGRRPSFTNAAQPETAKTLYEHFISYAKSKGINTQTGKFGAMMDVSLINKGPVTFIIESKKETITKEQTKPIIKDKLDQIG